jgi:hypothetical protein
MRRGNLLAIALIVGGLISTVAWGGNASAAGPGLKFPAPAGTQWEVLAGYNTPTHVDVDPYALDVWRTDGPTGGTPLLAPMSGTVGHNSDSCISIRTSEVNLLMCHVHALPELQRGQTVTLGQQIGTVANDGQAGNGGTAHIHLQLNARTSGGSNTGESLPFAGDYALEGQSLAAVATFNAYAGVRFTSTNDPSLYLPRVDAGPDRVIDAGATVLLQGTGTNVETLRWIQIGGPVVTLEGQGGVVSLVAPDAPGAVVTLLLEGFGDAGQAVDTMLLTIRAPGSSGMLISGTVTPDGVALVVYSGGSTADLIAAVGCAGSASLWVTSGGAFIGFQPDAPMFVNGSWNSLFAGGLLPAGQPVLVSCTMTA